MRRLQSFVLRGVLFGTVVVAVLLQRSVQGKEPVCLDKNTAKNGTAVVRFSPDGKWLAARTGPDIILWDFATRERVATFSRPYETTQPGSEGYKAFAFSPDSRSIVSTDTEGRVCLWDGSAGWSGATQRQILAPKTRRDGTRVSDGAGGSESAVFSPDGKLLAIPRGDRVKIVEVATGAEVGQLGPVRTMHDPQFVAQGARILVHTSPSARQGWFIELWNAETREPEERLRVVAPRGVGQGYGLTTAVSPAEDMLAVVVGNLNHTHEVRLYEVSAGRWTTLASNPRFMPHPSFSPDGLSMAVSTERSRYNPAVVLVYDLSARKWRRFECPAEIAQQNIACFSTAFSPDGRYLVGGLYHPQVAVCIWDLEEDTDKNRAD